MQGIEKHLIKHKSENTPGEAAFLFGLESGLEWRNGGTKKTK